MMTECSLRKLFAGLVDLAEVPDCSIRGLTLDSRQVRPGYLFLATLGTTTDGRRYWQAALAAGAIAVAYEANVAESESGVISDPRCFAIKDLRRLCGPLAARYYGQPSRQMQVIAVTGTNGKSTVCWLLAQALSAAGHQCAVLGTLGCGFPPALASTGLTTPDPVSLQQQLRVLQQQGAVAVALELSSHGLDQYRDQGLAVNLAVFTNLSRDHLDYHGSMENYAHSKLRLFRRDGLDAIIVNDEDPLAQQIRQLSKVPLIGYGEAAGDLQITRVQATVQTLRLGLRYLGTEQVLEVPLLGAFNAGNIAAVAAVLLSLQIPFSQLPTLLSGLRAPPGRMEYFTSPDQRQRVVVDFAHTPAALGRALSALRPHTQGQLWCVFGCGGNRDAGKRSQMGAIAEQLADQVVITDDNVRHEAPAAIVADIEAGMQRPHRVIHDRLQAIRTALAAVCARDLVLVAGKGHEQTQQIGDRYRPFCDRDVVQNLLRRAA